jgi:hypothetical protein
MGSDLASVCVFCAAALLGTDLPPSPGTSAEIGGFYSTLQRRHEIAAGSDDISNVTPKFVLVGLRRAEAAADESGAGTPAREWRVRLALAPSHDEQEQRPVGLPGRTTASGTGRYENFALLYRLPLGPRDSIEAAWTRRSQKATDLVNLGGENYVVSEERSLAAERSDVAVGARRRFRGWEIAAAARGTRVDAKNATAGANLNASGWLYGAGLEGRFRSGRWTLTAAGEALSGHIGDHEESLPDFAARDSSRRASFRTASASVTRAFPSTEISVAAALDRAVLPFVSFAVLGTETTALEEGFHPESSTRATIVDLSVRQTIGVGVRLRLSVQAIYGAETVTLTDAQGSRPSRRVGVDWIGAGGKGSGGSVGFLGSPAFAIGLLADFVVGRPGR